MRRHLSPIQAGLACALGLAATIVTTQGWSKPEAQQTPPAAARDSTIHVWMRDAVLYPLDTAPARVADLSGTAVPTRPGHMVVFDDVTSYEVQVEHTEIHISPASMTELMNRYILPESRGPIKHVEVSFEAGRIRMQGTMVKLGAPVPFTATAVAEPTPSGDMRLRVVSMTAAGIVPKGLMDALGLKMSVVAQPRNTREFHIEGDTMIMPVVSMLPPPKFLGRLRSVTVTPRELVAVIGSQDAPAPPAINAESYICFRGGTLKFARLTMQDADLAIVPKDDGTQLTFSPAHYYRQMDAGFTVPQPDRSLVSHVPAYASVSAARK
jgi:hypothetical protein